MTHAVHSSAPEDATEAELRAATAHAERLARLTYFGIAVALVVILVYAVRFIGPLSADPAAWGQFGDYVGGLLNPTFGFLALIALLSTFALQVRELRVSARELKNSADALTRQNETLRQQAFESTFFQLLLLHHEVVGAANIPGLSITGRAIFQQLLGDLEGLLLNEAKTPSMVDATSDLARFAKVYEQFYRQHQATLGHYFRLLYNIVKLVDRTELADRRLYTNLVRAQLSSAELKLIFYNCLTSWGRDKFKPLVERYALLKNIPDDRPPSPVLHQQYAPSAFGGRIPGAWQ